MAFCLRPEVGSQVHLELFLWLRHAQGEKLSMCLLSRLEIALKPAELAIQ